MWQRVRDGLAWLWAKFCDEVWTIMISMVIGGVVVAGTQTVVQPEPECKPCLTVEELESMIVKPPEGTCNEMCGSDCNTCSIVWLCCSR